MDVVTALNTHVKPNLADQFGIALANMIILQSSQKAGVSVMGLDKTGYAKLIGAIAADDRVTKMLGQAGAESKRAAWGALVT
jgi:hypothetical protein